MLRTIDNLFLAIWAANGNNGQDGHSASWKADDVGARLPETRVKKDDTRISQIAVAIHEYNTI